MNYNNLMEEIISSWNYRPKILLHSCCAPCSTTVLFRLKEYADITILYYNPNIEPYPEYLKRKDEEIRLINEIGGIDFIECDYNNDLYHELVKNNTLDKERGPRCYICYKERLKYTCKKAKELKFDYFLTTLTVSPYKVTSWINEIGFDLEKEYGVKYLPSDFKKKDGYKESIKYSEEYNLYRQNYCGCIYSNKNHS